MTTASIGPLTPGMILKPGSLLEHNLPLTIKHKNRKGSMELACLMNRHLFPRAYLIVVLVN
jgi:hypothetical protein